MENIYILLLILLFFWYFISLRKIAESARENAIKFCHKENIQFISIARISSKPRFNKRSGPHWLSHFEFEFSGDGQSSYCGNITLRGQKLENITTPPYRI